jgi:hypothetical protein
MDKCLRTTSLIVHVMPATKTRFPPRSVARITMTINGLTRCAVQPVGQDGPDRFRRDSDVHGGRELIHGGGQLLQGRENSAACQEGTTRRIGGQARRASNKRRTARGSYAPFVLPSSEMADFYSSIMHHSPFFISGTWVLGSVTPAYPPNPQPDQRRRRRSSECNPQK